MPLEYMEQPKYVKPVLSIGDAQNEIYTEYKLKHTFGHVSKPFPTEEQTPQNNGSSGSGGGSNYDDKQTEQTEEV
jgi:hypothetical protein